MFEWIIIQFFNRGEEWLNNDSLDSESEVFQIYHCKEDANKSLGYEIEHNILRLCSCSISVPLAPGYLPTVINLQLNKWPYYAFSIDIGG